MSRLHIDIETYSDVDLKKSGLYRYAQSDDFEVLLIAYAFDDDPVEIVDLAQGESIPDRLRDALFDPNVTKHAFNASFEWYCLSQYFGVNPVEWLGQWKCTMIHAMYLGYPQSLEKVGKAMGIPEDKRKNTIGLSLIRTFSIPKKKKDGTLTRTLPHHEPEKWELFKDYCRQDVEAEREISRRLERFPVPEKEWELWRIDQQINLRGVAVDMDVVSGALDVDRQVTEALESEAVRITGVSNPKSVEQLRRWLSEQMDKPVENLRKGTVAELLEQVGDEKARRVLEIRQELSKSSVKKYQAIERTVCRDGRVRGLFQFYGANRTGRWAGRLVQVQNLPRNKYKEKTLSVARELVRRRQIDAIRLIFGSVHDTLSQIIRTVFVPEEGKTLVVCDFSAIEARVVAWLAGEAWRLEVFRTHGKIYEASASQMFGVPIEQITKESELRQKGKIAELALGYQGGVGALISMGALDMGLSEAELADIVERWRASNQRIVALWRDLETAAIRTVKTGTPSIVARLVLALESDPKTGQEFFTIRLPSGRKLYYPRPFLAENQFGKEALHYYTQNGARWEPVGTYGGKLTENVVQAISRDCLAEGLRRLHVRDKPIVIHVHDEIAVEVPSESADVEEIEKIMAEPIPWADGLPLAADGFSAKFYQK